MGKIDPQLKFHLPDATKLLSRNGTLVMKMLYLFRNDSDYAVSYGINNEA